MKYLDEMAAQGYDADHIGSFHNVMLPYLVERLGVRKDDLIVDVGAAQGHCVIAIKSAGYGNLAAIDIDPRNFKLFFERHGIRGYQCDVDSEPIPFKDGEVRLILSAHLIEHLKHADNFLSHAYRALQPGGAIAIVTPDWRKQYKTFWRDPTHVHPYDKEAITRLLRIHAFRNVRARSWGSAYGLGRLQAYRWSRRLGFIGRDMLAVGVK